jgi:glycosyltransferase involved in cell wall biosynthesis
VRYQHQGNRGQTVAKNLGIRMARGELVAFLDADDYWLPQKLERQVPLSDNLRVGVTYTGFSLIDQDGEPVAGAAGPTGHLTFRRGRVTHWLGFDNFVPFSASMVRRGLLEDVGGFDEALRMSIDWDIWLRLSCLTEFDFVPDRLIAYRVGHPEQMSRNVRGRHEAVERIFDRFVQQHPDAFTPEQLREIHFYNACSRGGRLRPVDLRRSTALFFKAWRLHPLSRAPYVGLVKNAIAWADRTFHPRAGRA